MEGIASIYAQRWSTSPGLEINPSMFYLQLLAACRAALQKRTRLLILSTFQADQDYPSQLLLFKCASGDALKSDRVHLPLSTGHLLPIIGLW